MDSIIFVLGKLVGFALKAETWLIALAVLAYLAARWRWHSLARRTTAALVVLLVALTALPVGNLMARNAEAAAPRGVLPQVVTGIILLGGGEDIGASSLWGTPQLNAGGDRHLAVLTLARRYPDALIYISGGDGRLNGAGSMPLGTEAQIAKATFLAQGIAEGRMVLEEQSRTTAENAQNMRVLAQPDPDQTFVLVTSARHMNRALSSFQQAGWVGLVPYPTDYRSKEFDGMTWSLADNLSAFNTAVQEGVGRIAYAVLGR